MSTLNLQVGATADDRFENDDDSQGAVDYARLYVYQYDAGSSYRKHTGARFTGLGLSAGDTINTATAQVDVDTDDDPYGDIFCQDLESPPDFANGQALIYDRERTSVSAEWATDGIGTGWKTSPSLAGPVQEVVTDYDVDNLVLLFIGKEGAYKTFKFKSYDENGNVSGPKLDIDYTAGGVTTRRYGLTVLGVG